MRLRTLLAGLAFVLTTALSAHDATSAVRATETPQPSLGSGVDVAPGPPTRAALSPLFVAPKPNPAAPPLLHAVDCFNYDTNFAVAGVGLVPPDPHGAAGPNHIVVIGNVIIEWRPKNGTISNVPQMQSSLKNFFFALPTTLGTNCFDPR
jgi:hypothetical protein